jgi:hypothetical protein
MAMLWVVEEFIPDYPGAVPSPINRRPQRAPGRWVPTEREPGEVHATTQPTKQLAEAVRRDACHERLWDRSWTRVRKYVREE